MSELALLFLYALRNTQILQLNNSIWTRKDLRQCVHGLGVGVGLKLSKPKLLRIASSYI